MINRIHTGGISPSLSAKLTTVEKRAEILTHASASMAEEIAAAKAVVPVASEILEIKIPVYPGIVTSDARVTLVTLTPDMARELLALNWERNRKSRPGFVKYLAEQILLGRWQLTGDAICILENGKLGNGQHRCEAVVLANMPVQILLLRNVSIEAYKVMDNGNKCSVADNLNLPTPFVSLPAVPIPAHPLKISRMLLPGGRRHTI
jgi:hypothetical protein